MGSVVDVQFTLRWTKPVYVGVGDKLDVAITGPADVVRYIINEFGIERSPKYWRARSFCHHALRGEIHPELARQPFIDAWVNQSCARLA